MNIKDNKNFSSVQLYNKKILIKDLYREDFTKHLKDERKKRFYLALEVNKDKQGKQSEIDRIFLVDKGHKDGPELHCVTKKGVIYILNKEKYENGKNSFITILFARPNQVKRLYEACNLELSRDIYLSTINNINKNLNNS